MNGVVVSRARSLFPRIPVVPVMISRLIFAALTVSSAWLFPGGWFTFSLNIDQ